MIRLMPWTGFRRGSRFLLVIAFLTACVDHASANEPLHDQIDRLVEAPLLFLPAPPADDAEFLRRVSLDLCDRIASIDEVRSFLQDPAADKRQKLIDRLLASPQFARRLANYLDVTLMERRRDKYVPRADWENWLYQACLDNQTWDRIARELITADGADPARRSPAKFCLEREADPNLLTRDVGRIFFGRDIQCAQCHDHPIVKDFEQREYYGLLSFFQRTELFKDPKGVYMLAEKADGDATFQSVFASGSKHPARPALPGNGAEPEPRVEPGKEYSVAPADKVRPVPTISRRELLAKSATAGANRAFNRNMANRLWAMMMGRGLVHPVDFDHADNPATHPELLNLLADEFAAMKYDMRALLREVALSKAYQRSFDSYPDLENGAGRVVGQIPALESDASRAEETVKALSAAWKATRRDANAAQDSIDKALAALRAAETALGGARKLAATTAATVAESQRLQKIKTDANAAIAVALEQVKQALGKLATDAELKLVVEKLQAKSTNLAAELGNLAKTIQSQSEAAQKATAAVEAAQQAVNDLAAKFQISEQQGQPALAKSSAARLELQRGKAELAVRERRLRTAKLLGEYRFKNELLAQAQSQAGTAPRELDVARSGREDAAIRIRVNQRRLASSEQELESLRKQIAAAKKALELRQPALDLLPAANEQIEKAASMIKDDELTRAAGVIRQRLAALSATTAAARQQLADQESAEKALVAKVLALRNGKAELEQALAAAQAHVAQIQSQHQKPLTELQAARTQSDSARQSLLEALAESYAVAPLKPLSAEQIHWSVLQATGILASYEVAAEAELNKRQAPTEAQKTDAAFQKQRIAALEREVHGKLAGNLAPFVQLFGCGPGQPQFEFFATADQALFMENSDTIRAWTAPGVTLIQRLTKRPEPAAMAEELYLSVLNRLPTSAETAEVAAWFARRDGPSPAATSELAWAVLASVEFRFSH
jgi:Protein of unknown function (DUF1549)/Protein of unknown function (DUF1553)